MIFYHFTYPQHVESILRDGLKPADASASNGQKMTGGRKVVWLTPVPTLIPTRAQREAALKCGCLMGPFSSSIADATVCLKVVVPSTDRKLKEYWRWLLKHAHEEGVQVLDRGL
jgi:hypothetical protein